MKHTKYLIIPAIALVVGLSAWGASKIYAADSTSQTNPMNKLVNAIATKFNLNVSDVQAVFDEHHEAMQAEHHQAEVDRLAQAVTDGKLTQEQVDKITAKHAELQAQMDANRDNFANLTQEQRRAQMEAQMKELEQWATDNNIPREYLRFGFKIKGHGPGGPGGREFFMHRVEMDASGPTTIESSN